MLNLENDREIRKKLLAILSYSRIFKIFTLKQLPGTSTFSKLREMTTFHQIGEIRTCRQIRKLDLVFEFGKLESVMSLNSRHPSSPNQHSCTPQRSL